MLSRPVDEITYITAEEWSEPDASGIRRAKASSKVLHDLVMFECVRCEELFTDLAPGDLSEWEHCRDLKVIAGV